MTRETTFLGPELVNSVNTSSRLFRSCSEASTISNAVYCLPYYVSRMLKIDPNEGTLTDIGPDLSGEVFPSATFGGLSGTGAVESYYDHNIYFVPQMGNKVYYVDPRDDSVDFIEFETDREHIQNCDQFAGVCTNVTLGKYGGYLAMCQVPMSAKHKNRGKMYAPPGHVGSSGEVTYYLKVDPKKKTATELRDYPYDLGVPLSQLMLGKVNMGAHVSCAYSEESGKIYSPPSYFDGAEDVPISVLDPRDDSVMEIRPSNGHVDVGFFIDAPGVAWSNGAYVNIYKSPSTGKLISPPFSVVGAYPLVVDPSDDTAVFLPPLEFTGTDGVATVNFTDYRLYYACALYPPTGMLYCPPDEQSRILSIDTETLETSQDVVVDFEFISESAGNYESAVTGPDGTIFFHPYYAEKGAYFDPKDGTAGFLGPDGNPSASPNAAHTDLKYVPTLCDDDDDCRDDDECLEVDDWFFWGGSSPKKKDDDADEDEDEKEKPPPGFKGDPPSYCTPPNQVDGFLEYRASLLFGLVDTA
mmetsp:Transcript_2116/g.7146  ORF Transcript_2116/g.7146 Transcript_2116/m.7146 type:complete len:526 (-) Transcript_2116:572-2149(-)